MEANQPTINAELKEILEAKQAEEAKRRGVLGFLRNATFEQLAVGLITAAVLGMVSNQVMMGQQVAAITSSLEAVKPKDVAAKVDALAEKVVTRDEAELIVAAHAPWKEQESEWLRWRARVDASLGELVRVSHQITERLDQFQRTPK